MEPVFRFQDLCSFTWAEVLRTINEHFGHDGSQSNEIVVPEPGGTFIEYEDECEDLKEYEEDRYYDEVLHTFGDACAHFELFYPPSYRIDYMMERFIPYREQAEMYDSAAVMERGVLANVQ